MKNLNIIILLASACLLASCSPSTQDVTVNWQLNLAHGTDTCQTNERKNQSAPTSVWSEIGFYAYDFKLLNAQNEAFPLQLTQSRDLIYVDLTCKPGSSNEESTHQFTFTGAVSGADILEFTIGVPFAKNHLNPLQQQYPLNQPAMFWVWQTGHKFFRLEGTQSGRDVLFHLGSTGCVSASALRPPEMPCQHPNRVTVQVPLTAYQGNSLTLTLDPTKLLKTSSSDSSIRCQSEQDNTQCPALISALKNNIESGVFTLQ
ncbi:MbnP family copper-binding protein [Pleionea litopenaei]|uniref:Metallo-mystery pair system four-Cys motif protein n=1 Tax=Pleionea litopenaei TaxID=3070815 RepID=A0AA51X7H1_9GAMM|nr:MbnP family copper-binding protein [Pleionea sp. HL-JVS1]WMS88312.1 metallo-mystery pair system four-Cys motif protein [Pleionea sp. HL-JVS1]